MFTITDILPSTKTIASIKLPDYKSGKVTTLLALIYNYCFNHKMSKNQLFFLLQLEVQHLHEHTSFTTAITLNQSPVIDFSSTIGTPSIAFGAEGSYSTVSGKFLKYNAGVSLTKPDSTASVIL